MALEVIIRDIDETTQVPLLLLLFCFDRMACKNVTAYNDMDDVCMSGDQSQHDASETCSIQHR